MCPTRDLTARQHRQSCRSTAQSCVELPTRQLVLLRQEFAMRNRGMGDAHLTGKLASAHLPGRTRLTIFLQPNTEGADEGNWYVQTTGLLARATIQGSDR